MKRLSFVLLLAVLVSPELFAQDENRKPEIEERYKMFRKTMTRRMDLSIKQNRPFNSRNGEISRILFEALEAVGLEQFLKEQPDGLDTIINPEGKQMSYTIAKKIILATIESRRLCSKFCFNSVFSKTCFP